MATLNGAQFGNVQNKPQNIPGWPGTFAQKAGPTQPALNIPGWPGTFSGSAKPSAPSAGSAPAKNIPGWPGTFAQPSAPKNPALNIPGWPGTFGGAPAAKPAAPAAPAASPSGSYAIQRGDTLSGIAASHNMPLSQLYAANPEFKSNPKYQGGNMIFSGGKVNLSGTNNLQMKNAAPAITPATMKPSIAGAAPSMGNAQMKPSTPLLNQKQMGSFGGNSALNLPAQMGKPAGMAMSPNLPAQMAPAGTPMAPQSSMNLGSKISRMQP